MPERNNLEAILSDAALELFDVGGYPIDVERVCKHLGVVIHRDKDKRQLACVLKSKETYQVKVADRDRDGHKVFDEMVRFLVLHEIAHVLLEMRGNYVPQDKSDYWQHEALADRFAREMLIPSFALLGVQNSHAVSHMELMQKTVEIARKSLAPWTAVAHRVSEISELAAVFLVFRREPRSDKWKVVTSTLPGNKEKGRIIASDELLGKALCEAGDLEAVVPWSADMNSKSKLKSLTNYVTGSLVPLNTRVIRGVFTTGADSNTYSDIPTQMAFSV